MTLSIVNQHVTLNVLNMKSYVRSTYTYLITWNRITWLKYISSGQSMHTWIYQDTKII